MNSNIINFNDFVAAAESPKLESSLDDRRNEATTDEDYG